MSVHLQKEIVRLKKNLLALSAMADDALSKSLRALHERDEKAAHEIIARDTLIDDLEVDLEEECLKVLALHQPVAVDLRFIVTVMKINDDLERIGDLAVNIAERAIFLSRQNVPELNVDFQHMAQSVKQMFQDSLDAFVEADPEAARAVCSKDHEVDALNRAMYTDLKKTISDKPEYLDASINLLSVSRTLERVADLATNIAEDVIYMTTGEIVRHNLADRRAEWPGA